MGIIITFGFCYISTSYLMSFMFQKGASAYKHIIWINLLALYGIPFMIYALSSFNKYAGAVLVFIFPFFSFFMAFLSVDFNSI